MSRQFANQFTFGAISGRMMVTGVSFAAVSSTGVAYWRLKELQRQEEERKRRLELQLQAQAAAMSKDLILGVLKSDHSLKLVSALLLQACKHQTFRDELAKFLKHVFVENPRGAAALKKFVVDQVILDPWVKEHLLALVKGLGDDIMSDPRIWPGMDKGLLGLLKDCAMESLTSDQFTAELYDAVRASLWGVLFDKGIRTPREFAA
jgi:hypothetical protein